jgi:hypothetical protein
LAGVAYFVLSPTFRGALAASVLSQGYLVVDRNNLTRPAFGINAKGNGAIAVSLVGPDYYPSAAFAPIRPVYNSTGTLAGYSALLLQLSAAGAFPQDGFSGYEGDRIARWGDYSTAVASGDGSIWMVTEYIPNAPRTKYANWGTWVTQFMP